nr:MAG TPA: hypothetical protein [Caudoviricetes sp.]
MTPEEWRMTPNKVGRTVYMPKLSYHGYREVTIQSVFKDTAIVKWQEIKVRHGGKVAHWKEVFTAFQPCQTLSWENPAKGGRRK